MSVFGEELWIHHYLVIRALFVTRLVQCIRTRYTFLFEGVAVSFKRVYAFTPPKALVNVSTICRTGAVRSHCLQAEGTVGLTGSSRSAGMAGYNMHMSSITRFR